MISFQQLQEGVYDKNIFKAIFLAGGPGSGKSFVARKTMPGLGLKTINSDIFFEKLIKDADIDLDLKRENTFAPTVSVKLIVSPLPLSSLTNILLTIVCVAVGQVYNVVLFVVVKSAFAFL